MLFRAINNRLKKMGFQQQLSVSFIVSFIVVAICITSNILYVTVQLVNESYHKQGAVITRLFALQSDSALAFDSKVMAADAAELILSVPNIEQVALFDSDLKLFYQKGNVRQWEQSTLDWNKKEPLLEFENSQYWQFIDEVSIGEEAMRDSPFGNEQPKKFHLGYVRVLMSKSDLHVMIKQMIVGISIIVIVILAIILTLQRKLIQQMTNPLYKLISAMESVRRQSDWQPLHTGGAPEWKKIVGAFNVMMISLRQHEHELEQKRDEALEALRLKSEFAANISHELRTPMNGILGMMELLGTMDLDKRQQDYVKLAQSSGEQLYLLINDILDFSKLDAGYMELDKVSFNLPKLMEELITLHSRSTHSERLEMVSLFDSDIPQQVIGDVTRLRQLLNNLIGNGVKFTAQGSVSVELHFLKQKNEQVYIRIIVCDTGIGIAQKDHQRIFDPYSQQDGSTNRKFGGTGLGLAISWRIVALMQGSIEVDSKIGQGSRFIADIPFTLSQVQPRIQWPPHLKIDHYIAVVLCPPGVLQQAIECRLLALDIKYQLVDTLGDLAKRLASLKQLKVIVFLDRDCTTHDVDLEKELTQIKSQQAISVIELIKPTANLRANALKITDILLEKPLRLDDMQQAIISLAEKDTRVIALSTLEDKTTKKDDNCQYHESNLNVLVVEDNLVNQKVATGMLNKLGIHADIVADGLQAIEAVKNKKYDLVLMDCQMPVIDGYHAAIEIRRTESQHRLPIIALTANTSPQDVEKCMASGMDDYLAKPVRLHQLQEMLERWVTLPTCEY